MSKDLEENPEASKAIEFKTAMQELLPAFSNIATRIASVNGGDMDDFKKISVQLYEAPKKTTKFGTILTELLSEPLANKYKASAANTKALCEEFNNEAKSEMDIIQDSAYLITNPKLLKYFNDLAKNCEESGKRLNDAIVQAGTSFNEDKLNTTGKICIEEVSTCVSKLQGGVSMGTVGELLATLGQFSNLNDKATTAGKMKDMIDSKDLIVAPEQLEIFSLQARKQCQLIDWLVQDSIPTQQDTLELSALNAKARSLIKPIEQSIRRMSTDPDSVTAKELELFSNTAKEIETKLMTSNTLCKKNVFFNGASNNF